MPGTGSDDPEGSPPDLLEAFHQRLRDICENDSGCHAPDRQARIQNQAEHACSLADRLGILSRIGSDWDEFVAKTTDLWIGTEHIVEFSKTDCRYGKITIPPGFGLIPEVIGIPTATARDGLTGTRKAIEYLHATPLEYLSRWISNNRVFGDDVKLASVIQWPGGMVSFGITQPQYHGTPAEPRDIERLFLAAGWIRLKDTSGHNIFYNRSFDVLAIDAERRNCYLKDGELLPFDVILRHPDDALANFLGISELH